MSVNYQLFVKDAQAVSKQTGVPVSITLAQMILESSGSYSNGLSGLAANYKNLFGVKGIGTGGSVNLPTTEQVNGKLVQTNANFRVYRTYYDSILDHAKLLTADRYTKYTANAKTIEDYAAGIQKGGYATDGAYAQKLVNIIKQNNLTAYDLGGKILSIGSGTVNISNSSNEKSDSKTSELNIAESMFFNITRVVVLLGLVILMFVFFFKAFPQVEDAAGKVTSIVPAGKVLSVAKKAKKISTATKGVKKVGQSVKTAKNMAGK